MSDKQYYSCERNNYFFGKLMTVRDFESEQIYHNSKRRLGNRMLNGAGIVSGLDVILVDSRTFSLESGMAIDYEGREIIVNEPSVKRLSIIKGFEENKDKGDLYLCIKYKEEFKESTFSVAGSGKDSGVSQEYNRVNETYDLFVTDKKPEPSHLGLKHLVCDNIELYNKNGLKISLEISKYVNPGKNVKVSVIFEKSNVTAPISYSFDIGGEFFKSSDGKDKCHIVYKESEVSTYKIERTDYYLSCDAIANAYTDLVISKNSFNIQVGKDKDTIAEDVKHSVFITEKDLKEVIIENYYAKHFDEFMEEKDDQYIYLAKLHVISNESSYAIEDIEKNPFKQYLLSNELLKVLQEVSGSGVVKIESGDTKTIKTVVQAPAEAAPVQSVADNIVTGVERIELGLSPKVGDTFYSYEFVHGLGFGSIGVMTAIENQSNYETNTDNFMLFGESSLFENEVGVSAPNVKIASMVNPDKGTMKIGVRLQEKTDLPYIYIRWWAFKPFKVESEAPKVETPNMGGENVNVSITPNTTRVEPLGQVRFFASVDGASSQEVNWSLTEPGSGTIDKNGLYTAPSKEGVYEVRAQSVKFPDKVDTAYVVVSVAE